MARSGHRSAAGSGASRWTGAAILALAVLCAGAAGASDPAADASRLSDQAFAFLNLVSKHESGASPIVGAAAGFAGDAQTLANALKRADQAGAASAMASLQADRTAVDSALGANPDSAAASQWSALKSTLATLAGQVTTGSAAAGAGTAAPAPAAAGPATAGAAAAAGAAGGAAGPQVAIESRAEEGNALHIKGWFAGTNLKSAGIYSGSQRLEALHVDRIAGEQRVNFDLKLTGVQPGMVLRVYDRSGSSAEAMLETPERTASSDVEVMRGDAFGSGDAGGATRPAAAPPAAPPPDSGNTAEIPSAVPKAGVDVPYNPGTLAGVQINIIGVNQVSAIPRRYEVAGQINGVGVRRAGIYVDGRLARRIPISRNRGSVSFDTTFDMVGSSATIRAYGVGENFVESSLDLGNASTPLYGTVPYAVNPYAYGANPYAYGASPYAYGTNPYGNPYVAPYGYNNPYGYRPPYGYGNGYPNGYPPPNVPWWQRLLQMP